MSIYLDHAATTCPTTDILDCYTRLLREDYANPASVHAVGLAVEQKMKLALQMLAGFFDCGPDELIMTSGGTESINLALKGYLAANPKGPRRILISQGEHAATEQTGQWLEKQGYEVVRLPLTPAGTVDLAGMAQALETPCALISLILVNNETGAINPVEEMVRLRNQLQPQARIHLDAVQATGKIPWSFRKLDVDFLSGSGHKFGTPKGIGWLIARKGIRMEAQILGGGQQQGRRAGTENYPLVMTMTEAVKAAQDQLMEKTATVSSLRETLLHELSRQAIPFVLISPEQAVPHIISLAFPGLRGETLLHALSARGIYVSTGSACSARLRKKRGILQAMGITADLAQCSIRISLSSLNTGTEMMTCAQNIAEIYRWLARP